MSLRCVFYASLVWRDWISDSICKKVDLDDVFVSLIVEKYEALLVVLIWHFEERLKIRRDVQRYMIMKDFRVIRRDTDPWAHSQYDI